MADIWRGFTRYEYRPRSSYAAMASQLGVSSLIALQTLANLPIGVQTFPDRLTRRIDTPSSFVATRVVPTITAPVGVPYYPSNFTPRSRYASWDTQQPTSAQVPLLRPPVPPPGGGHHGGGGGGGSGGGHNKQIAAGKAYYFVAGQSQSVLHGFTALDIAAVPSAIAPPGQQYFPVRNDRTSSYVAVNAQRYLFWFPLSQTAIAMWTGTGAFSGTGVTSNRGVAAFSGSTSFNPVSTSPFSATFAISARGVFNPVGAARAPAVASWIGSAALSWQRIVAAQGVAVWSGFSEFRAVNVTVKAAVESWAGSGKFLAKGAFSNNLPFNYPPSWSIMIYAPIIEGAGYDPTTQNLKVWFTNTGGQFIIIGPFPFNITNAIEAAPNPEAYILSLIK